MGQMIGLVLAVAVSAWILYGKNSSEPTFLNDVEQFITVCFNATALVLGIFLFGFAKIFVELVT